MRSFLNVLNQRTDVVLNSLLFTVQSYTNCNHRLWTNIFSKKAKIDTENICKKATEPSRGVILPDIFCDQNDQTDLSFDFFAKVMPLSQQKYQFYI